MASRQVTKEKIMHDFSKNKINILLSTTVIEVGIDVPNATVMLIENAERFGLTQLHQLRGRVGQEEKKVIVFWFKRKSMNIQKRSKDYGINDGFKISDEDLKMRGPVNFLGLSKVVFSTLKLQIFCLMAK